MVALDEPIWAFHGAKDEIVPLDAEQMLVDALKACGGEVHFIVYPDDSHDISDQVYSESKLHDWMLSHLLK